MNSLKLKWNEQTAAVKAVIVAVVAIVGVVFVIKILPALVAAMGIGLLLVLLFVPYWAPTIIAFVRKHPSKAGIGAVNFFFGWTFVGWVLSLAWALSDNSSRGGTQSVVVQTTVSPSFMVGSIGMTDATPQYPVGEVPAGQQEQSGPGISQQQPPTTNSRSNM